MRPSVEVHVHMGLSLSLLSRSLSLRCGALTQSAGQAGQQYGGGGVGGHGQYPLSKPCPPCSAHTRT
eukprot:3472370-Rhodomonas_salina.1